MSFRLVAAALAVGISIALSSTAFPRGEWPDGPNKAWFENYKAHSPGRRSDGRGFLLSYFALAAPALGQPAIQALTASAVPRFCIPPPAATLLRLHFSIQAGSFWALAGVVIVREATMPAAANAKISFMRAPSCLMASTIQRSVFVYCCQYQAASLTAKWQPVGRPSSARRLSRALPDPEDRCWR